MFGPSSCAARCPSSMIRRYRHPDYVRNDARSRAHLFSLTCSVMPGKVEGARTCSCKKTSTRHMGKKKTQNCHSTRHLCQPKFFPSSWTYFPKNALVLPLGCAEKKSKRTRLFANTHTTAAKQNVVGVKLCASHLYTIAHVSFVRV